MEKFYQCMCNANDKYEDDLWTQIVSEGDVSDYYPLSTIFKSLMTAYEKTYRSHIEARANIFTKLVSASRKLDTSAEDFIVFAVTPLGGQLIKLVK